MWTLRGRRLGLLSLLLTPDVYEAAHSRRRIVIRREKDNYDRVITDFSPEGRLGQVEYGIEASRRGATVAAAVTDEGICLVVQNTSFGKMHRIDHHIWLVTAGLSGDARFLAEHLRRSCQVHRNDYGEAPTTEEVARMVGKYQHYLTRSGGIRPLGCTALILGIDTTHNEQAQLVGVPKVYQADPGGIVETFTSHCVAGKGGDAINKDLGSIVNDRSLSPATLPHLASEMAIGVLGKLDDPKMVDVWTIEPKEGKRGGMLVTCYQNLNRESASKLGDIDKE